MAAPWFCVKSTLLGDTRPDYPGSQKKVFLNVCTQLSVPKPPEVPASVLHDRLESPSESDPYLIPIVLAEPREDVDKGASNPSLAFIKFHFSFAGKTQAGKPCLVIDCIINPENKVLEQKHGGLFKTYLIGVATARP